MRRVRLAGVDGDAACACSTLAPMSIK
jgi:hypothetical protein